MAKYKGKTARVEMSPADFASKFKDLTVWSSHLDNMTDEVKAQVGEISFEPDSIILKNPAIGQMKFDVAERTPDHIVFKGEGMIPIGIEVQMKSVEDGAKTDVTTVLDVDIPMMLRPLVGNKLQQVADVFGDMIGKLATGQSII